VTGRSTASRKRIGGPPTGARTVVLPGAPPARPCVEPLQAAYCRAWQDAHRSAPTKSSRRGSPARDTGRGAGNGVSERAVDRREGKEPHSADPANTAAR